MPSVFSLSSLNLTTFSSVMNIRSMLLNDPEAGLYSYKILHKVDLKMSHVGQIEEVARQHHKVKSEPFNRFQDRSGVVTNVAEIILAHAVLHWFNVFFLALIRVGIIINYITYALIIKSGLCRLFISFLYHCFMLSRHIFAEVHYFRQQQD